MREQPTSLLPWRVSEVVRLNRRGLVVLDAEHEVCVMGTAAFAEQTVEDNAEGNDQAARIGEPPIEDRVFAAAISSMTDSLRALAAAGARLWRQPTVDSLKLETVTCARGRSHEQEDAENDEDGDDQDEQKNLPTCPDLFHSILLVRYI